MKSNIQYCIGMQFFLDAALLDNILFCNKITIQNTVQMI